MNKLFSSLLLIAVTVCIWISIVSAQAGFTITGHIADKSGKPLSGALVLLKTTQEATKKQYTLKDGSYSFTVSAGEYAIIPVASQYWVYDPCYRAVRVSDNSSNVDFIATPSNQLLPNPSPSPTPTPTPLPTPTPTPMPSPTPTPSPSPSPSPLPQVIWVDDSLPAGATITDAEEPWNWVTTAFSGTAAHQSAILPGIHQHYFTGSTPLVVNSGDKLFTYIYLNPTNTPTEIMIQWYAGGWSHRAYWGDNSIEWGTDNTPSRFHVGPLPATGQWVRLEVPASAVDLEGQSVTGIGFTLFGGQATWDYTGKTGTGTPIPTPTPTPSPTPIPSPTPTPTPNPNPDKLVVFSSPEVEFIVGPQVESGSSTASGAQWFDQNAIDRGLSLGAAFPDVAHTPGNTLAAGTVSTTKGDYTNYLTKCQEVPTPEVCKVRGVGTHFTTDAHDLIFILGNAGARIVKYPASIQSDTELTLTTPWVDDSVTNKQWSSTTSDENDNYVGYLNYYDFCFTQYNEYYRTNDQRFLTNARKCADSWWSSPAIDYGKNYAFREGNGYGPRTVALNGLILRALDGRPEMWPWIKDFVDDQFHNWDEVPNSWPAQGYYFGIRDGGFMLLYAAELGAVYPDPAVRADFKTRALNVAKNYFIRLQSPDGSFRWDDAGGMQGVEQPFMVGMLNEGLIAVHKLTGDTVVRDAILKSVTHEYNYAYNSHGWRAYYYFVHGKIGIAPDLIDCEHGCGVASLPWPPAAGHEGDVQDARALNATSQHQYGYAYLISGDPKYKQWGDEIFDSSYSGNDGYRGIAWYRGKDYDEAYRTGGKYLAYRLGTRALTRH